jgi:acetolactate synthase-1/2/3 large subunit
MERIKSSDLVAQIIKRETDVVFGVTGGVVVNIFDAIARAGIKIINTHHEQSAAIAADAYSRLSGKLGTCIATSGPGALNLISGVACSYFDSVPMLVITGQVVVDQLRKDK